MDKDRLLAELQAIIDDYIKSRGLELVDIIFRQEGKDLYLRILVDWPQGGITIAECASLNNELSALLDEKNIIERRYILEVSSPGLDRPLMTINDYARALHRRVRVFLAEPVNGKLEWTGEIDDAAEGVIILKADSGAVRVEIEKINKAKQIIE